MSSSASNPSENRLLEVYGDLLFDLCNSMLWDWSNAQVAFKKISESLQNSLQHTSPSHFQQNERAYVLQSSISFLRNFSVDHAKRLDKHEQLSLDSLKPGMDRQKMLSHFFQRLQDDEKLILLLKDKYGLPFSDISSALSLPEGTLKVRRSQSIRSLANWIWGEPQLSDQDRCFELDFNLSDILDGTLPLNSRRELDQHAASCNRCKDILAWSSSLSRALAEEPRASLPIPIRKADFSQVLPRATILGQARSWWMRLPWYLRSSSEGLAIVGVILLAISLIPKVRSLYERSLERGIEAYQLNTQGTGTQNNPITPTGTGELVKNAEEDQNQFLSADQDESNDGTEEPDSNESDDASESQGYQKNPHIWRFNIKTDNLEEAQALVRKTIKDELPHSASRNDQGITAPGGIQFDILVPENSINTLKAKLEKLAQPKPAELKDTPGEAFSWYKSRAKGKIPKGKTRLVIWLTQY